MAIIEYHTSFSNDNVTLYHGKIMWVCQCSFHYQTWMEIAPLKPEPHGAIACHTCGMSKQYGLYDTVMRDAREALEREIE